MMYKSYINKEKDILLILLEYGNEIKFKKRLQGYGLKDSDFDKTGIKDGKIIKKYPNCSRRVFAYWKPSMLKRKLITQLRYRGRKEKYYSITPLGVCYLCQLLPEFTKYQAKKILDNLKIFYESKPFGDSWIFDISVEFDFSKIWEKFEAVVLENDLIKELHYVCSFVTIIKDKDDYVISISYPLHKAAMVPLARYRIFNDTTVKELHKKIMRSQQKNPEIISSYTDIYSEISYPYPRSNYLSEINSSGFFYWISMFILYAIHYRLIKRHFDESDKLLAEELYEKGEAKGNKLKHIYKEMNRIGLYEYDVKEVARIFSNNLNFVLDLMKSDLEQFDSTLEMYALGKPIEAPKYIETVGPHTVLKSKKLGTKFTY